MSTNDFKAFAAGGSANVLTQSAYVALTTLISNGIQTGILQSNQLNKIIRQPSIMASMIGQIIVDVLGQNATDDGTITTLEKNLASLMRGSCAYSADTGAANAYVVTLPLAPVANFNGTVINFLPAFTNTGASTVNVNGLGVKSILKKGSLALTAGDIVAGSIAMIVFDGTNYKLMNIGG